MAYAQGRTYLDADSHLMELPDFLTANADASVRDRLPEINFASGGRTSNNIELAAQTGAHTPEAVSELVALGDDLISGPKGYDALGAFNSAERATALDLLGFTRQFVFATFSAEVVFDRRLDADTAYGAARAHNRGMAQFTSDDERLVGVAMLPLDDPDRAVAEIEYGLSLGLGAFWVPHRAAGGRSPGHNDVDRVWAALADAGVPFLLHVGGEPLQMPKEWLNTGRAVPSDWLGGGENLHGKDMVALHHAAERFVGVLVLDGVLQRHPNLRGGVIELGAGWVPSMLRRLDHIAEIWKRSEPELAALNPAPSQQVAAQMAFTPYPFEDVGQLVRQSNADLYLFSSDYPHYEGGRNPLGRFNASLAEFDDDVLERFYSHNMADLLGQAA